jgi:hypothetical protein
MRRGKAAIFLMIFAAVSILNGIARLIRAATNIIPRGKEGVSLSRPAESNTLTVNVRLEALGGSEACIVDQLISSAKNKEIKFIGCGGFI